MVFLETLDLSPNKMGHLDANIFVGLQSLKFLDLSGNTLHHIDAKLSYEIIPG